MGYLIRQMWPYSDGEPPDLGVEGPPYLKSNRKKDGDRTRNNGSCALVIPVEPPGIIGKGGCLI